MPIITTRNGKSIKTKAPSNKEVNNSRKLPNQAQNRIKFLRIFSRSLGSSSSAIMLDSWVLFSDLPRIIVSKLSSFGREKYFMIRSLGFLKTCCFWTTSLFMFSEGPLFGVFALSTNVSSSFFFLAMSKWKPLRYFLFWNHPFEATSADGLHEASMKTPIMNIPNKLVFLNPLIFLILSQGYKIQFTAIYRFSQSPFRSASRFLPLRPFKTEQSSQTINRSKWKKL